MYNTLYMYIRMRRILDARSGTACFVTTWKEIVLKSQKAVNYSEKVNLLMELNSPLQNRKNICQSHMPLLT